MSAILYSNHEIKYPLKKPVNLIAPPVMRQEQPELPLLAITDGPTKQPRKPKPKKELKKDLGVDKCKQQ